MIYDMENPQNAEELFRGWEETLIWSCLQKVMGKVYGNSLENPESAAAVLGDFCFFAGKPDRELVSYKPEGCKKDFMIMIPQDEEWAALILECLKKGLYPSWDAQNKESVILAEKLGYHYDHDYAAYEIWGY